MLLSQFFVNLDQAENELLFLQYESSIHVYITRLQRQCLIAGICKVLIDSIVIFSTVLIVLNKYHTQWKVAGKLLFYPYDIRPVDTGKKKLFLPMLLMINAKGHQRTVMRKQEDTGYCPRRRKSPKHPSQLQTMLSLQCCSQ